MMTDVVSVLVPVYNAQKHLERCISSVFAQTYGNLEVIAVDDGSTDGSPAILARLGADHPDRLRVITQQNQGVAVARNRAIDEATGSFLTFLDDDDYLDPDFVERMLALARNGGYDIVCGGFRRPDAGGRVTQVVIPPVGSEWERLAVEPAWAKLYRTDFVRGQGLRFLSCNIGEDLHFTLPALLSGSAVGVFDYCGYNWFLNDASVSNTLHKSSEGLDFETLLDALVAEFVGRGIAIEGLARHVLVRLVVWFLFYTASGDDLACVEANVVRYRRWLDARVPSWRGDEYARLSRPTGDAWHSRAAVSLFVRHPVLFRQFLRAYRML